MGASNKYFLDKREVEEHEKFDHNKKFCEKVKQKWFSTEDFSKCNSMNIIELTEILIKYSQSGYRIDYQDFNVIMKMIDEKEPEYLSRKYSDYFKLVTQSPLANMGRVYEKYTLDGKIKQDYSMILQTKIMEVKRLKNG